MRFFWDYPLSPGHDHNVRNQAINDLNSRVEDLEGAEGGGPHDHDDSYYTEAEVDAALAGKASTSHSHAAADTTSGAFDIARIPTGTSGTTVSLGNHNHTGVYDAAGTAAAEVATHAAAADPHTGYQKESEKGAANGYASLNGSTKVPIGEIPTGTTGTTVSLGDHTHAQLHDRQHSITSGSDHTFPGGTTDFLRADGTFAAPPGGGGEAFPVGAIFISVVSTNPATLLGYGTWSAFGAGRTLVGLDSGDASFDTVKETGGAKTHTLTTSEMPAHVHDEYRNSATTGGLDGWAAGDTSTNTATLTGYDTGSAGGGAAHNNLQPYIVTYFWERTA